MLSKEHDQSCFIRISDGRLDNKKGEHLNNGEGDGDFGFLTHCATRTGKSF